MSSFKTDDFEIEVVREWLLKRFTEKKAEGASDNSATKRVDKNSSMFSAMFVKRSLPYRKWSEVLTNMDSILDTYKTPSSKQCALSLLRILCVDFGGYPSTEWTKTYGKKNEDLKAEYMASSVKKELVGMSFKDAKKFETDDDNLRLYLRLMCGDMPILRLGDFINSSTIDDGKNNYIDVKKKTLLRRISKNNKGEMSIKLPKVIIDEIKKQDIKGPLFGELDAHKLTYRLGKLVPDININSRHFRNLYSTTKITKMRSSAKMLEAVNIMDHSPAVWLNVYQKAKNPIIEFCQMAC